MQVNGYFKANRLSLNVGKTKLLFFHSKQSSINLENISIKIEGKKLSRCNNVNYLGLLIDEHLSWDAHVKYLSKKLSRANGVLAKLRHFAPKHSLDSVYYAIFYSHVVYGCPTLSLTTAKKLQIINVLKKMFTHNKFRTL